MKITKQFFDIHGRKYIELDGLQVKVPFRYNRVTGVDVQGHVPIQDMPTGTQVKAEIRTVKWDGLEYYVLKSICPSPQGPKDLVSRASEKTTAEPVPNRTLLPSPAMESVSRTALT
jgi:hypothetical protein